MSITLKAGSGTVVLNPAGVSISGSQVRINSGGGAGSAKSASPTAPKSARAVDPGKPESALNVTGANQRFKQQPVEFDASKGKQVDEAAFKKLEKTYKRTVIGNHQNSGNIVRADAGVSGNKPNPIGRVRLVRLFLESNLSDDKELFSCYGRFANLVEGVEV